MIRAKKNRTIGFDRRIRHDWLDATADWAAKGLAAPDIRANLEHFLEGKVVSANKDGARRKTITVLLHIWVLIPERLRPLRDAGLAILRRGSASVRLPLHWGMCMASYPFFGAVTGKIGRLLRLQDSVTLEQVRRRIVEEWGDTERVHRSVRHVVQTLRDWRLLIPKDRSGSYITVSPRPVTDVILQAWLIEAYLLSSGAGMIPFRQVTLSSSLFPFSLDLSIKGLGSNPRLEVFHQGLAESFVMLRKM